MIKLKINLNNENKKESEVLYKVVDKKYSKWTYIFLILGIVIVVAILAIEIMTLRG